MIVTAEEAIKNLSQYRKDQFLFIDWVSDDWVKERIDDSIVDYDDDYMNNSERNELRNTLGSYLKEDKVKLLLEHISDYHDNQSTLWEEINELVKSEVTNIVMSYYRDKEKDREELELSLWEQEAPATKKQGATQ